MIQRYFLLLSLISTLAITAKAQPGFSASSLPAGIPSGGISPAARWLTGDFDNDGDVDVLYKNGNTSGENIFYLENNGAGVFSSVAASTGTFAAGPFSGIAFTVIGSTSGTTIQHIADYDNDGDIDIFELTNSSSRLLVNDNGTWSVAATPANFPASVQSPVRWVSSDFDNDGDIDILYQNVNTSNTGIFYLENNGSGAFTSTAASGGTFGSGPFNGITFANIGIAGSITQFPGDYDNDGDIDIFELGTSSSRFLVNNNGTWSESGSLPGNFPSSVGSTARWVPGDFDGDGDLDILYQNVNTANTGIFFLLNDGTGNFSATAANGSGNFGSGIFSGISFTNIGNGGSIVQNIMDADNDGDFDIIEITTSGARFLEASGTAPALVSSIPADDAGAANPTGNITLNFNQNITAGTGNIYIHRSDNGMVVQTIAANGAEVSGSGTNTITIDPDTDLNPFTGYYLSFDKNAFYNEYNVVFGRLDFQQKIMTEITAPDFLNFTTSDALPVRLIGFTAERKSDESVQLRWTTAQEMNNSHFLVQRSEPGNSFETIGSVKGQGSTTNLTNYSFADAQAPNGQILYRLVQYDFDGKFKMSDTRMVGKTGAPEVRVYPNPSTSFMLIEIPRTTSPVFISLLSANGQVVYGKQHAAASHIKLYVGGFTPGVYTLKLNSRELDYTQQVIIR